jgi:multidrug resistance efflux pump
VRELRKIPIPWSQRWRSLRVRTLPVLVFGCAVAGTVYLWNRQLISTQAVGEVYGRRIDLAVQYDGIILDAPYRSWKLYDRVEAGQLLARLDDRPTLALIDTVRKEVEQARGELAAAEEEFRTTQDDRAFERYREARELAVDIENRKLAIAERKALLVEDQMELERQRQRTDVVDRLMAKDTRLMSELDTLEIERLRDVAMQRIKGHQQYIASAEALLKSAVERYNRQTAPVKADLDRVLNPLRATIDYQLARIRELEAILPALEIRSPIAGYIVPITLASSAPVQPVATVPGQQVRAGTVLFTIAAEEPEYIVSYVRPTLRLKPEVGMTVAIRPRNGKTNQVAHAIVDRVGPQVELVPSHQVRDQRVMEWGLPVRIPVPRSLPVRPGELVDLKFLSPTQLPPPDEQVATRG